MVSCWKSIDPWNKQVGLKRQVTIVMKTVVAVYFIFVHLFIIFVFTKSDFLHRVGNKLNISIDGIRNHELTNFYKEMVRYHSRVDGNVKEGSVIFIGDSLIQGLCVSAVSPLSVNYGIGNDTTFGMMQRIGTYESINKASAVVVCIGINDIKFRSDEDIISNYLYIINLIPRSVPLIINGIFPIDTSNIAGDVDIVLYRIKNINMNLESFSKNTNNLFYVDISDRLADAQGRLAAEFHNGDGIHLNAKGNAIWIEHLKGTLKKITQS